MSEVNYQTARNWKRNAKEDGDDWDVARAASELSHSSTQDMTAAILESYLIRHQSTLDEVGEDSKLTALQKSQIIASLADSYLKVVNAASKSSPAINKLAVAMEVIKLIVEFIKEKKPHLVEELLEVLDEFGQVVSAHYG